MPSSEDIIIISGFKTKVNYYNWFTVPAWAFIAAPLVALFVGAILF